MRTPESGGRKTLGAPRGQRRETRERGRKVRVMRAAVPLRDDVIGGVLFDTWQAPESVVQRLDRAERGVGHPGRDGPARQNLGYAAKAFGEALADAQRRGLTRKDALVVRP